MPHRVALLRHLATEGVGAACVMPGRVDQIGPASLLNTSCLQILALLVIPDELKWLNRDPYVTINISTPALMSGLIVMYLPIRQYEYIK